MDIQQIHVKNYRCLKDTVVEIDDMTSLIGPNGSGKSSIIDALELFYDTNASYSKDDFYNEDFEKNISIRVTFGNLSKQAKDDFSQYISGDTLSVEKVLGFPDNKSNQTYHGSRPINPDFDAFRDASGQSLRKEYEKLKENGYPSLPEYTNKSEGEDNLKDWESAHPEECERRREETQFFGYSDVGRAGLEEYTKFISIPAVKHASEEASDTRNSGLTQLMDMAVRSRLSENNEIDELQSQTENKFESLVRDESKSRLKTLEEDLSKSIGTFAPGVEVQIDWVTEGLVDIDMPDADIDLVEDGYPSKVENAGHGSQRAFIITLLQELTLRGEEKEEGSNTDDDDFITPSLVLAIEEPELYQHPDRQRHLRDILSTFEDHGIAGAAKSVQVIYSTHSPLMVDIERFDDIRSLEKTSEDPSAPKNTDVSRSSLIELARRAEEIEQVPSDTFSAESVRARLEAIMTPWINEGFFADRVILVEGLQDRAAFVGYAENIGLNLSSEGIAIIPCNGKSKLGWPAMILRDLGKSVYVVFDSDKHKPNNESDENKHTKPNHRLQRIFNEDQIVDWPSGIYDEYACFEEDLNSKIIDSLGEKNYTMFLESACEKFGYPEVSRGEKNPVVMSEVFSLAEDDGLEIDFIEEIFNKADSDLE